MSSFTQNIHLDTAELSVPIIIISVLSGVGVGPNFELSFHHPAHAVVLHGHPIHEGTEDLILDLLDATVSVEMLTQCHHSGGDDLVDVVVNDTKLSKVFHL